MALVADTHDAPEPVASVRALERVSADYYVHLGDVGTAPIVNQIVRTFKQDPQWREYLSPDQQERYEQLCRAGTRPVLAYIEARLGNDPELRRQRFEGTIQSYAQVVEALRRVPNPMVVAGNVDRVWLRHEAVRQVFADSGAPRLVEWPRVVSDGTSVLLLWPSIAGEPEHLARLADELPVLQEALSSAETVVVCAHEQLFRGPAPDVYRANVMARGLSPRTIPGYAPSPTRRLLVMLLAALPEQVRIGIASGHIHDSPDVVHAGAPYLRTLRSGGLAYRLPRGQGRSQVELFPVPSTQPAVLRVDPTGFRFNLLEVAICGE